MNKLGKTRGMSICISSPCLQMSCVTTAEAIDPLMDSEPVDIPKLLGRDFSSLKPLYALWKSGMFQYFALHLGPAVIQSLLIGTRLGSDLPNFYELVYAPASKMS